MQTEPVYRTVYTRWARAPASQSCFGKHGCKRPVDKHAKQTVVHTRFSSHSFTQRKLRHLLLWQAAAFLFNNTFDSLRQTLAEAFDIIVFLIKSAQRFSRAVYSSRDSVQHFFGVVSVRSLRIQAAAVSCSISSCMCPGCFDASLPIRFLKPCSFKAFSKGAVILPVGIW